MDCELHHEQGPRGALASAVEAAEATGHVVVLVPRVDWPQARRELRGIPLLPLDLEHRTLDQAADGVFPIEGRCVVLAAGWNGGWDLVVTPGAQPKARPPPPPAAHVGDSRPRNQVPLPVNPRSLDTAWVGASAYVGSPDVLGYLGTAKVGPVAGEVGVLPMLFVDVAFVRGGLMAPVAGWRKTTVALGALAGAHAFYVFDGVSDQTDTGIDGVAALDWMVQPMPQTCLLLRAEVGAGRYDWGYAHPQWLPTVELSFGAEFGMPLTRD